VKGICVCFCHFVPLIFKQNLLFDGLPLRSGLLFTAKKALCRRRASLRGPRFFAVQFCCQSLATALHRESTTILLREIYYSYSSTGKTVGVGEGVIEGVGETNGVLVGVGGISGVGTRTSSAV